MRNAALVIRAMKKVVQALERVAWAKISYNGTLLYVSQAPTRRARADDSPCSSQDNSVNVAYAVQYRQYKQERGDNTNDHSYHRCKRHNPRGIQRIFGQMRGAVQATEAEIGVGQARQEHDGSIVPVTLIDEPAPDVAAGLLRVRNRQAGHDDCQKREDRDED